MNKKNIKTIFVVFAFLLSVFGIYFFTKSAQEKQNIKTSAAVDSANVFFSPSDEVLPTDKLVKLFVTAGASVGFIDVELLFDNTKVAISDEIVINQPSLATVIEKTTKLEANNTGRLKIIVAVDPAHRDSPPTGTFDLADIKFSVITQTENANTSVTVDLPSSQIVALDSLSTVYTLTAGGLSLSLNPVATPTPTNPTQPTDLPTTAPTDLPTNLPTILPTDLPTTAPTDLPTTSPTTPPTNSPTTVATATGNPNSSVDVNEDGSVNMLDIGIIVENYQLTTLLNPRADVNGDGSVNIVDIGIVVENYRI
jgi:hypothetical protein